MPTTLRGEEQRVREGGRGERRSKREGERERVWRVCVWGGGGEGWCSFWYFEVK